WNMARQRYCRRLTRYRNTLRVSADLVAKPAAQTRAESRVLDLRKLLRERDRLSAGGRWIRTIGTPQRNKFSRPPPFDPPQFAFRERNRLLRTRNRCFESTSLQERDGMGQAARRWHHRRCNQLMECPDAPAERPRPSPGQALSRSLVALDQDSTIVAVVEMSQSSWLVAGVLPGI